MKKDMQIAYLDVTPQKQQELLNQIKLSSKYNIFNTFSENGNIDDKIIVLSDSDFSLMTKVFPNRMGFFNALMQAEDYIDAGHDVPHQLWGYISQVRKDYLNYVNH